MGVYRPKGVAGHRFVGDKRSGVAYDLDAVSDGEDTGAPGRTSRAAVDELLASGLYLCFAPDTPAEVRNRGYRLRGS